VKLVRICESSIKNRLTVEDAASTLGIAHLNNCEELKEAALLFIGG
jgi:hypothetical protein